MALVTGAAGGIGRAVLRALSGAGASVVAFDIDGDGAADAVAELRRRRRVGGRRRHLRGGGGERRSRRRWTPSAASTSSSPTPGSPPARRSTRRRWPSGSATSACSAPATSWSPARRSASAARRARGGSIVFVASKNSLVAGHNAAAYSSPRRPSCTSRAAWPRRAAPRASASTPSTPTPCSRARGSGTRAGARSAPPPTASPPTSSRSTTASAPRWASTCCPRTSPRRSCTSPPSARSGKSTGNILNVDGGVAGGVPALARTRGERCGSCATLCA